MTTSLRCGAHTLDLSRPRVMGILNVTPDSFSDGGRFVDRERALDHARRMIADGADLIDVGGESTRPGAEAVSRGRRARARAADRRRRSRAKALLVSIDTMKPAVMRAAIAAGAAMINDVRALRERGALEVVARTRRRRLPDAHARRRRARCRQAPRYGDVVAEVRDFPACRARSACEAAGIARERIVLDPGFGFGKTLDAQPGAAARACRALVDAGLSGARRTVAQVLARRDHRPRRRTSGSPAASPRCSRRSRAVRRSCACTTCARRSMR